jgi:hypothetical protein
MLTSETKILLLLDMVGYGATLIGHGPNMLLKIADSESSRIEDYAFQKHLRRYQAQNRILSLALGTKASSMKTMLMEPLITMISRPFAQFQYLLFRSPY